MKLFGSYTSPYVRHCRIALKELHQPCEFMETDYSSSATGSPNMRVPFLQDGPTTLTDSTSILMHLYLKSGASFISTIDEMELYTMANTALDTTINLFLLERDNLTPKSSPYLRRQQSRIKAGLEALNNKSLSDTLPLSIAETRLVCFLDWAIFRQRIELSEHANLQSLLALAKTWPTFNATAPR